jgi:hypothetical protein
MDKEPIFILGAPRSGTTFLASMLKQTKYGAPFETHFITKYYKQLHKYGDLDIYENYFKLISKMLEERPVMQWQLHFDIYENFKRLKPNIQYKDIINQICLSAAHKNNKNCWGDKTPHYINDIEIIYNLFPDSKYLYIVRDGRDVALSLLKKPWGPNNIYECAEYWKKLNAKEDVLKVLANKGQLYSLRYEDLLDNTQWHTKNIYKFLNEEITETTINQIARNVKKGNYGKWKSELTESQIKIFENIAAKDLMRFGYTVKYHKEDINIGKKIFYKAHHRILLLKYLFTINVIDGFKIKFLGKQPFAD